MGPALLPRDWTSFLEREYLSEFIKEGGASVKFAVPLDDEARLDLTTRLEKSAASQQFLIAQVDAAQTRVHMMDQLFFCVAEQVPWDLLARSVLDRLAREEGYAVPEAQIGAYAQLLAQANDLDESYLRNELRRRIIGSVFRRKTLARDFRIAMSQLCTAQLAGGADGATTLSAISDWLTGRNPRIGAVKPYGLYTKINRSNARFMFESLLDWIRFAGYSGFTVLIDIRRLTIGRNPRDGLVHYTKAGRLDAYELLRQFVDATDRLHGFLLVVTASPEFLDVSPQGAGLGEYQALYFRVFDEIRDRDLVNPMSALVRLSSSSDGVLL